MQSYEDYLKYVLGESNLKMENLYKIEKNEGEEIIDNDRSITKDFTSSKSESDLDKKDRIDQDIKIHTPSVKNNIEFDNRKHIEKFYPEIYKKISPIISDVVVKNKNYITEDVIEKLTDQVYSIVERNGIINTYFRMEMRKGNNYNQNRFFKDLIRLLIIKRLLR